MKLNPFDITKYEFLKQFPESYVEGGAPYYVVDEESTVFLLSTMMTPHQYNVVFKSVAQVESIFGRALNRLTVFDLMYFTEVYRGSQHHCKFEEQHACFKTVPEHQQHIYLNHITKGTFDFRDYEVAPGFDLQKHIKKNFPKFKPTF